MKTKNSPWFTMFLGAVFLLSPVAALDESSLADAISIPQTAASLLLLLMVIGVLYNLWRTTRTYGGIIGQGLRRLGIGIVFLSVEALDRIAQNFGGGDLLASFIPKYNLANIHDALFLLGLFFLALGFSRLSSAVRG